MSSKPSKAKETPAPKLPPATSGVEKMSPPGKQKPEAGIPATKKSK